MIRELLVKIYCLPLHRIIGIMALLTFLWLLFDDVWEKSSRKVIWKLGNGCIFTATLLGIVITTVFFRNEGTDVVLIPFYSFVEARIQPEIYRSMLMNIFLFFPLGLTLPFLLPEKWKHKALITILFALILSISIEFLQYYYHLGRAETDDVLCNTLGCAIGTLSYTLERKVFHK